MPPGWATDLAVLERSGAELEDHGDHLVVRTPSNPQYHWGNCLFVLDNDAVDDAVRWTTRFETAFPDADWFAAGLMRMPSDIESWTAAGVGLEEDEVLVTQELPKQPPAPDGYSVRQLAGADWEQTVARELAENERTDQYEAISHETFVRARVRSRTELCNSGRAAFFGAFDEDSLVAELGIVRCDQTARYQAVSTDAAHRGRGLASHLLGVAATWSVQRGCDRWVIITESTNPAGRVYRRAGFVPGETNAQAYRRPRQSMKSDV